MAVTVDQVRAALARVRFVYAREAELQEGIGRVLEAAFPGQVQREVQLDGGRSRLDFLVGAVAVEVKIDGSLSELTRQVHRYAGLDAVAGILAVVGRSRLRGLPESLRGKPVGVLHLGGAI